MKRETVRLSRLRGQHARRTAAVFATLAFTAIAAFMWQPDAASAQSADQQLDPAAWGEDHVNKKMPLFTEGGECLFCHRSDAISKWDENAHQRTMRLATPEEPAMKTLANVEGLQSVVDDIWLVMGGDKHARYLKRSAKYGQVEILPAKWRATESGGEVTDPEPAEWNAEHFAQNCAGCHASGVDRETLAYQAVAHDCFVCHGEVPTTHAEHPEQALFSKTGQHSVQVLTAICASCHIRTGTSKATGRPYPTNFIAGDNLFKDFNVDFSDEAIAKLNPNDAHVLMNVRDVVVRGIESETCMTCHDVHNQNTDAHEKLKTRPDCYVCHEPGVRKSEVPVFEVHSAVCEY